jgi:hypothetical protein
LGWAHLWLRFRTPWTERVCLEQTTDSVCKSLGFLSGMCPAAPAVQTSLRRRGNQIRVRKRELADLFWEGEFCNSAANPKKPSQVDAPCCRRGCVERVRYVDPGRDLSALNDSRHKRLSEGGSARALGTNDLADRANWKPSIQDGI